MQGVSNTISGLRKRLREGPLQSVAGSLHPPLFQAAWAKWGSKRLLWEKMRAYFYIYALESMRHLFEALCDDLLKPTPTLANDSC